MIGIATLTESFLASTGERVNYNGQLAYELGQDIYRPGKAPIRGGNTSKLHNAATMGMSSAGLIGQAGLGLYTGGFSGMVENIGTDLGSELALTRHHYQKGINGSQAGQLIRPGLFQYGTRRMMGTTDTLPKIGWLGATGNTLGFIGKGIVGGGIGGAIGGSVGGSIGGVFGKPGELGGTFTGAFIGARAGVAAISAAGAMMTSPVGWVAGGAVVGVGAATLAAAGAGYAGYKTLQGGYRHRQKQKMINTSGDLAAFSTGGANTMRARAVQAIAKSHLNARSALGQESQLMFTRNYHSQYRRFY